MSDSSVQRPHSMQNDFDLVRSGLKEVPPHDHDFIAWNALDRIEEQFETLNTAVREYLAQLDTEGVADTQPLLDAVGSYVTPNPASRRDG